jgi:hypothetical protein
MIAYSMASGIRIHIDRVWTVDPDPGEPSQCGSMQSRSGKLIKIVKYSGFF